MPIIKSDFTEAEIDDILKAASSWIRWEGWVLEKSDAQPYDFVGYYHGREIPVNIVVVAYRAERRDMILETLSTVDLPNEDCVCFVCVKNDGDYAISFEMLDMYRLYRHLGVEEDEPKLAEDPRGAAERYIEHLAEEALIHRGYTVIEKSPHPQFDFIAKAPNTHTIYSEFMPVRIITTYGENKDYSLTVEELDRVDYDNEFLVFAYNVDEKGETTSRLAFSSRIRSIHEHYSNMHKS